MDRNSIFFPQTGFDAAIIDLDGTLVDTLDDFVAALNAMLGELALFGGLQLDRQSIGKMVGKGSEHLVISVLDHAVALYLSAQAAINKEAVTSSEVFDRAFEAYQRHYAAINGRYSQLYPGVLDGLQHLTASRIKLACLTNKPLAFARQLLHLKGLDAYFTCVFGGDSFERKKPDPLPLLKTCVALGTPPARTLMIGDSSNDAVAARAAGCPVILVTYGYNHGEPVRDVDADGFIDSLVQLISP